MDDEKHMRRAIAEARQGIEAGQSPFGVIIIYGQEGSELAADHNRVWERSDPTAHAEVNAIRAAAQARHTINLEGCTLYSTCEPCPMCMAAIHWARLDRVVYGAGIADAARAGFHELRLPAADLAAAGGGRVQITAGLLAAECAALFDEWRAAGRSQAY